MVQSKPAIAELVRSFPQLASSQVWTNTADQDGQWLELARLVIGLYQQENYVGLQSAFDRLEDCLDSGAADVRSWVTGFLQSLQDVTNWSSSNIEVFVRFLGPNGRRIWETLNVIRFDLSDCPILEAEILMWRVVHHKAPAADSAAKRMS
jgi:hypothetical protein